MSCVKILAPEGLRLQGHLIEERVYARVRDVAEALGYQVDWQPPETVLIAERPRPITGGTDLRLPSRASVTLLDNRLKGTPLMGLGADFWETETYWRVNAVFACAVACHESDFGRSAIARDKHNLFGFMAFDDEPYGYAKSYKTHRESIDDFCKLISREYLNPAGAYYGCPSITGVGRRYATDPEWASKVLKHCQAILGN